MHASIIFTTRWRPRSEYVSYAVRMQVGPLRYIWELFDHEMRHRDDLRRFEWRLLTKDGSTTHLNNTDSIKWERRKVPWRCGWAAEQTQENCTRYGMQRSSGEELKRLIKLCMHIPAQLWELILQNRHDSTMKTEFSSTVHGGRVAEMNFVHVTCRAGRAKAATAHEVVPSITKPFL